MAYFRRTLIISSALTLLALLTPFNTVAQSPDSTRADAAGYTSTYALNAAVRQLAYRSQRFKGTLERELNRSYLDGTPGEKRANQLSARFHTAAETLRSLYSVGRNVENSRTEAFNLLQLREELDYLVSQADVSRPTLRSWDAMNRELFLVATVYGFRATDFENADTQRGAYTPEVEYHSAASSYSRIWRWPF